MNIFKKKYDPTKFDSLISQFFNVNGDIDFTGSIVIDGRVNGNVESSSKETTSITVGKTGELKSDIIKSDFIVVEGTIHASELHGYELIIFKKTAIIKSDNIFYNHLQIEEGAIVEGKLVKIEQINK